MSDWAKTLIATAAVAGFALGMWIAVVWAATHFPRFAALAVVGLVAFLALRRTA